MANTIPIPVQLKPVAGKSGDRRAWSIPRGGVWLPFFTATNTMGETAIPAEVLGAPVRLVKETDGTPRFSKAGRPVMRLVRELSDQIRIIRENFAHGLLAYATTVANAHPDATRPRLRPPRGRGHPLSRGTPTPWPTTWRMSGPRLPRRS